VAGINEAGKAFVLNIAGYCLHALGRLADAAQHRQASLEARIAQESWKNAAINAGNLSELHLTLGDVAQALAYAEQSVELADCSGDAFIRTVSRTWLADALHQAGRIEEGEALFRKAEAMQEERQPQAPLLYSLQGYRYCDLLLGRGQAGEVLKRAEQTLEWAKQYGSLLDLALDHLSLGRAHLLQAQQTAEALRKLGSLEQAARHLNCAVDGLRQAGDQEFIARGLLARAPLHRVQGQYTKARRDLEEALSIATRGGMRLHEADCHLEYARLHLAQGRKAQAGERLDEARAMIGELGYHRRNDELAALEEQL
jgi:tetratricopeptide (TPR) repeat protein